MSHRRVLSLWFPRLAAERCLRETRHLSLGPFAVVEEEHNSHVLVSLSAEAQAAGLRRGQPLRDARAMCPELQTRLANNKLDAAFLALLRRWAGRFSPWVAEEAPESLMLDLTGCAHLFGGEEALARELVGDCGRFGVTVRLGIADTVGAAWALARFAGEDGGNRGRSGDDIDQEAPATRSRAARRRHWERGGPAPALKASSGSTSRIAPHGQMRTALGPLPVAALRIAPDTIEVLNRLGLRRIDDLSGQPRASLARRFGRELVQRLDQAMGVEPEPVGPARPSVHFALRLTFPEPIGLSTDIAAALDRLLPVLGAKLRSAGQGARRLHMECHRSDHTLDAIEVRLARPSADPNRMRSLLLMKLGEIDAGFGIDMIRLAALQTEPVQPYQHSGHTQAAVQGVGRLSGEAEMDDLVGRIGGRIGLEAITRAHPGDSHIPEKAAQFHAAAWSEPAQTWPRSGALRPLEIWRPEIVTTDESFVLPPFFRLRGRDLTSRAALGPERITSEWWLDEPDWRNGSRDYWQVTTQSGDRLWLYYAHGAALSPGWFCQGSFC